MAPKVFSNKYSGIPGSSNFLYKFPKGITLDSVSYALDLIETAHGDVPEGLTFSDFYLGELTQIYPTLNIEIGRHFVLEREAKHESNQSSNNSIHNSSSVSSVSDCSVKDHTCQLCDLKCDASSLICIRCKCINQRLDQLTMEMTKVQHAIDAILDTPQSSGQGGVSSTQGAVPPNQRGAPSTQGAAPTHQRGATSTQGAAPTHQRGATSTQGAAPTHQRGATSTQGAAPTHQRGATSTQGAAPTHQRGATSTQGAAPTHQRGATSMQGAAPTHQRGTTFAQGTAPNHQRGASPMQGSASTHHLGTSVTQGTAPSNQRCASVTQGAGPQRLSGDRQGITPPTTSPQSGAHASQGMTSYQQSFPPLGRPPTSNTWGSNIYSSPQPPPPGTISPLNVQRYGHFNMPAPYPSHHQNNFYNGTTTFQRRGNCNTSALGAPSMYFQGPPRPPRPALPRPPQPRQPVPYPANYHHHGHGQIAAKSYASAVRAPPSSRSNFSRPGCENCGEPNHRALSCRHGMKLQCRRCLMFGHKAIYCSY